MKPENIVFAGFIISCTGFVLAIAPTILETMWSTIFSGMAAVVGILTLEYGDREVF